MTLPRRRPRPQPRGSVCRHREHPRAGSPSVNSPPLPRADQISAVASDATLTASSSPDRTRRLNEAGRDRTTEPHPQFATGGFVTPSGPGAVIRVGLNAPAFLLARVRGPGAADPPGAPL